MYRVSFEAVDSKRGIIEGYATARRAKEVVATCNANTDKHGTVATSARRSDGTHSRGRSPWVSDRAA